MICRHQKTKIIFRTKSATFFECLSCKLILTDKEEYSDPKNIYENYYKARESGRFNFGIEYVVKVFRLLRAAQIFFIKPKARSILDIGSGRGWTLYALKKYFKYKTAVGTQIAPNAYKFSKEKLGLEIYNRDLLEIKFQQKFDLITLWHVLEHVRDPQMYLKKIYQLLVDSGIMIIEVPNFNSWSRALTEKHWLALDLSYHMNFFTPDSLISLLQKYNFKIKKLRTFSLEHSAFTSTQSFVNLITKTDDYFFKWLQKGNLDAKILWHLILFAILFPICFLINLGFYFSKEGEVIRIFAEKQ